MVKPGVAFCYSSQKPGHSRTETDDKELDSLTHFVIVSEHPKRGAIGAKWVDGVLGIFTCDHRIWSLKILQLENKT